MNYGKQLQVYKIVATKDDPKGEGAVRFVEGTLSPLVKQFDMQAERG